MSSKQEKPKALEDCPDWGKGGSYMVDPTTGVRTLIKRDGQSVRDEIPQATLKSTIKSAKEAGNA